MCHNYFDSLYLTAFYFDSIKDFLLIAGFVLFEYVCISLFISLFTFILFRITELLDLCYYIFHLIWKLFIHYHSNILLISFCFLLGITIVCIKSCLMLSQSSVIFLHFLNSMFLSLYFILDSFVSMCSSSLISSYIISKSLFKPICIFHFTHSFHHLNFNLNICLYIP